MVGGIKEFGKMLRWLLRLGGNICLGMMRNLGNVSSTRTSFAIIPSTLTPIGGHLRLASPACEIIIFHAQRLHSQ